MSGRKSSAFRIWQTITIVTLFIGYNGYYFCRTNLMAAAPLIIADNQQDIIDIDLPMIGLIGSIGTLTYAFGKFFWGTLVDFVGGRLMFLLGMCGSIFATLYFGVGLTFTTFVTAWAINQSFQAIGWGAALRIISNWVRYQRYGRAVGILSLSYLFGDAIVRLTLAALMQMGYGWRSIFVGSATILSFITLCCAAIFVLTPKKVLPYEEIEEHPMALLKSIDGISRKLNPWRLLRSYFSSLVFWVILILAFSLTIIRETFNTWSNTLLNQLTQVSPAEALRLSALFPFVGGISAVVFGFIADLTLPRRRGAFVTFALIILALTLMGLWYSPDSLPANYYIVGMCLVALLLIGPYTLLAVWAIEIGGKKGSSTSASFFDGIGYLGSVFAGYGIASFVHVFEWKIVFLILSILALVAAFATILHWYVQNKKIIKQQSVQHE